jgi:hypothetical protein
LSPTAAHIPIRQDKTEDEVFVFAIVDEREGASAMERDTSRPPESTSTSADDRGEQYKYLDEILLRFLFSLRPDSKP